MRNVHVIAVFLFGVATCTLAGANSHSLAGGEGKRKPVSELPEIKELPNPFLFLDGSHVKTTKDWERRRNLPHLIAWLSDRFVTGSQVWFESARTLRELASSALGAPVEDELRFPPWRNNVAFLIHPRPC